ncbi:tetratricopeptide repeat protein [Variovorax sp. M-6]|uniref:tetratricopeptide repeat protein n=1 Tax=Variovorax sp. M-6 TaxID=3233041 RepID=UPI003F95799A
MLRPFGRRRHHVAHSRGRPGPARRPPAAALAPSPDVLFTRAECLEAVDVEEARRLYEEAIAVAPHYTNAYLNLGALLCDGGDCDKAVRVFSKGIEHRPDEPLLYFNRAVALEDLNRFEEALASYDLALQLDPNLADAHFNVGSSTTS